MSAPALTFGGNIVRATFDTPPNGALQARKLIADALESVKPGAKLVGSIGQPIVKRRDGVTVSMSWRVGYREAGE